MPVRSDISKYFVAARMHHRFRFGKLAPVFAFADGRTRLASPRLAPALRPLLPSFRRKTSLLLAGGTVWTDDRAPVEWITDRMLAEQIARGEGLDERLLPTRPR